MDEIESNSSPVVPEQSVPLNLVECYACNKLNEVAEAATRLTCSQCGLYSEYHQCPNCKRITIITQQLRALPKWACRQCKFQGRSTKFHLIKAPLKDVSGLRDYYVKYGVDPDQALAFPGRVIVNGAILGVEGLSGLASGGCTMEFGDDLILVMVGTRDNTIKVPFQSVRNLNISGRGAITTTKRQGGGFFGGGIGSVSSMGEGMLMSHALNALSTKTVSTTTKESIVTLQWESGGIVIRNTNFVPLELTRQIQHVLDRLAVIESSRPETVAVVPASVAEGNVTLNLTEQLGKLAELHQSGVLTDEEFAAAKSKLLAT